MRVLLLDEGFISGTVTARGLRRAGCLVDVIAATGGRGRCVTRDGTWRLAPRVGDPRLLDVVTAAIRRAEYDVVYPVTEPLQWIVWDARPAWEPLVFPRVPEPHRAARRDKSVMSERVAAAGGAVPRQLPAGSDAEVRAAVRAVGLPLVVKGARGRGGNATRICATLDDALAAAREMSARGGGPFAQAHVGGPTYLAGGLFDGGRPLRFFAGVKTVQYPPRVGPAAVLTSAADAALAAAAAQAAAAAEVTGLASMDFVRDPRGRYLFLELNPRPWGSIDAAARAGVDLFAPLVDLWRARAPAPNLAFAAGVRTPVFPLYLLAAPTWRSGAAARAFLPDVRRALALARAEPDLAAHLAHRLARVALNWTPPRSASPTEDA